jgi:ribosomal protein S18 acetylase RimI-like enzyme
MSTVHRIRIRPLTKDKKDVMDYVRVRNDGYSTEPWFGTLQGESSVQAAEEAGYVTFVAEKDGIVVGLIDLKCEKSLTDVDNLVVLKDFRRMGVGAALLSKAIDYSRAKGCRAIRAECPVEAVEAARFYIKNGFETASRAYLVSSSRPILSRHACRVGQKTYWVPTDEDLIELRKSRLKLHLIRVFNVFMKKLDTVCEPR